MRVNVLLLSILLAGVALSGCATNEPETEATPTTPSPTPEPTPEPAVTQESFTLSVTDAPATATAGEPFTFTLAVEGTDEVATDHVGAHYSSEPMEAPSAGDMRGCEHQAGELPGTFTVTCTIDEAGTWHVYGHARAVANGETYDFWADAFAVEVAQATQEPSGLTIETAGIPAEAAVNESFTFTLYVNGSNQVESDHIGAHYADNDTQPPVATSMGGCEHQAGTLPGEFSVACTIPSNGTWYVYGHARTTDGDETTNHWAAPVAVEVSTAGEGLSAQSFQLETRGTPAYVKVNESFAFTLYANGSPETETDHVGAHFANNSTEAPVAGNMGGCEHQAGTLPGEFNVTCTLTETGTWYVFGHARASADNETYNFWADAAEVTVVGNYTLETSMGDALQQVATAGTPFNFTLYANGTGEATSDHVGAHYATTSTTAPSAGAMQACAHTEGDVPGEFNVSCTFAEAGTYYLYGHLRFGSGADAVNFWTADEYAITVS